MKLLQREGKTIRRFRERADEDAVRYMEVQRQLLAAERELTAARAELQDRNWANQTFEAEFRNVISIGRAAGLQI